MARQAAGAGVQCDFSWGTAQHPCPRREGTRDQPPAAAQATSFFLPDLKHPKVCLTCLTAWFGRKPTAWWNALIFQVPNTDSVRLLVPLSPLSLEHIDLQLTYDNLIIDRDVVRPQG